MQIRRWAVLLVTLVIVGAMAASTAAAATTVVVTPSNMQGWTTADTRPGGQVTFVTDPASPFPDGALQLTTDATTAAKAQYLHPTNTPLAQVTELSYFTKQLAPAGPVADPSYQLPSCLKGGTTSATCGFTTLVFEPYQNPGNNGNATVVNGVFQKWDVSAGLFYSTRTVVCSNGTIMGTPGGPPMYTLAQIKTTCPNAVVIQFGVNIGTFNPGYVVETDGFDFNGTVYDFQTDKTQLTVLKTASPNPAAFGQPLTYTVTVQSGGTLPVTAAQLSDPLPAGVTFQSVTTSQGSCSQASGTVTCQLGPLPTGSAATVTITVTPLVTGTLSNTATVTSPGSPPASGTAVTQVQGVTAGGAEPPVTGQPPLSVIGVPEVINPNFPVVVIPLQQSTPQQTVPQQTTPVQQPSFLINVYPPGNSGQPGSQQLVVGCNQVTISSPAGTAVSAIAARVTPAGAVVSIYRFSNNLQRYQAGYFAMVGAPIDFSTTGGGFESYQVCVNQPATITSG